MLMTFLVFLLCFRVALPLHANKFVFFDYRLTSVNVIVIHVLITTHFVDVSTMHTNEFDKATTTISTSTAVALPKLSDTTTTATTTISASIMLPNSTSSAIFMSNDVTIDAILLKSSPNSKIKSNNNDESTTAAINVDVNGFRMGATSERNRNVQAKSLRPTVTAAVVKHQRWIRDLLAMTAKNTTKSTSTTTKINTTAKTTTTQTTNALTKAKTKSETKTTPAAISLSSEIKNVAFITPRPAKAKAVSPAFTNISDSTQLPQSMTLGCQQSKETRILSRRKRFLTFPEGSSFSVAVCITVGIIGNPRFDYMAYGLNWGVAYDLPNASWVINHLHGFSRHPVPATVLRRRTRRHLYREVEAVVDNMGYNGRDCVLRALCESKQYFRKNKLSMVGEMLRAIFSLPKQRLFTRELREDSEIQFYDHAYRRTRDIDCSEHYDCSFSLLELAFGKYSTPPPGYYYQ